MRIVRAIDGVILALGWLSGGIAAFVMAVTFVGVVMRYVFRNPLMGGFEMIEIGMGLIVFTALPLMVRNRGNIRVTILFDKFSPGLRRITTFVSEMIGAALSLFMAWRIWLQGERMLRYHEVTMELRVPKGLIAQCMSGLLVVAAVAFAVCAIEALAARNAPARSDDQGVI